MNKKPSHYITSSARRRFEIWLLDNKLSMSKFAKQAGCSRQYLNRALDGVIPITENVREWFKKGGYELL